MTSELETFQKQYDEAVQKLNSLVKEVIEHQHPDIIHLSPEFNMAAKIAYVRNAIKSLEIFLGKY